MAALAKCSCCRGEVTVASRPAKWQGEEPKVVITHKKWQSGYTE